MRLLFCCEFYFPSVGGVQEVMRQLAERMVQRGHDVTVATTRLAERSFSEHNGVRIVEFGISGNAVRGIEGEVERYREFVTGFDGDAILIKAAQQWTFDALWPVLDEIRARKVFIPCGFSGLYEPTYEQYFRDLPDILRRFDHLIFTPSVIAISISPASTGSSIGASCPTAPARPSLAWRWIAISVAARVSRTIASSS
ncbi:hypothetical protein ACU4HD_16405 [Cupriavidus basilensis]